MQRVLIAVFSIMPSVATGFDDWALVNKYCPLKTPQYDLPEVPGEMFFIYRDSPVYERTLRRAFDFTLGRTTARAKLEKESEFFGEVMVFCDLLKHPQRTWNASDASLFIVPAFPTLVREATTAVHDALVKEPSWQRSQGTDHLILCTHWACASRLGPLFESVALPGLVGALERNLKWLDPRLHRVDIDQGWARVSPVPLDLAKGEHPLCPERTIVLPYPAHHGIVECRRPRAPAASLPSDPGAAAPAAASARGATRIFFAGTLRSKLCGVDAATGAEVHAEPSHGVRPTLAPDALLERYGVGKGDGGVASALREDDSLSAPRNAFANVSHLYAELYRRGYHLQVTSLHPSLHPSFGSLCSCPWMR